MSTYYKSDRKIYWNDLVEKLSVYGITGTTLPQENPNNMDTKYSLKSGVECLVCFETNGAIQDFGWYQSSRPQNILELIAWVFGVHIRSEYGEPILWPDPQKVLSLLIGDKSSIMLGSFVEDTLTKISGRLIDVQFPRNKDPKHPDFFWGFGPPPIAVIASRHNDEYRIHKCNLSQIVASQGYRIW